MIFDMAACGGCRTCELACSYKHLKKFNPEVSSIEIIDKTDGNGYQVRLVEKNEAVRFPCDLCWDLETPECMNYCRERDVLKQFLLEFKERKTLA